MTRGKALWMKCKESITYATLFIYFLEVTFVINNLLVLAVLLVLAAVIRGVLFHLPAVTPQADDTPARWHHHIFKV